MNFKALSQLPRVAWESRSGQILEAGPHHGAGFTPDGHPILNTNVCSGSNCQVIGAQRMSEKKRRADCLSDWFARTGSRSTLCARGEFKPSSRVRRAGRGTRNLDPLPTLKVSCRPLPDRVRQEGRSFGDLAGDYLQITISRRGRTESEYLPRARVRRTGAANAFDSIREVSTRARGPAASTRPVLSTSTCEKVATFSST